MCMRERERERERKGEGKKEERERADSEDTHLAFTWQHMTLQTTARFLFTVLTHCKSPKGGKLVYNFSGNANQVVLYMYSASPKGKRNMYLSLYGIHTRQYM